MSDELLPCTFCGSNDLYTEYDIVDGYYPVAYSYWVGCKSCDAQGPTVTCNSMELSKSGARMAWNTRSRLKVVVDE